MVVRIEYSFKLEAPRCGGAGMVAVRVVVVVVTAAPGGKIAASFISDERKMGIKAGGRGGAAG